MVLGAISEKFGAVGGSERSLIPAPLCVNTCMCVCGSGTV